MMPPAPGRCSTMKGWPRLAPSLSATMRANRSAVPAAENGTTILTGRVGQDSAARAGSAIVHAPNSRSAPAAANAAAMRRLVAAVIAPPPADLLPDPRPMLARGDAQGNRLQTTSTATARIALVPHRGRG